MSNDPHDHWTPRAVLEKCIEQRDRARSIAVTLEQGDARVRELHPEYVTEVGGKEYPYCPHCNRDYPCATIVALDGPR